MNLKRSLSLMALFFTIVGGLIDYCLGAGRVDILEWKNLLTVLGISLVCFDNKNLQLLGIALCGLIGVYGIQCFFLSKNIGESMVSMGKAVLLLNPILYFLREIIEAIKNWKN